MIHQLKAMNADEFAPFGDVFVPPAVGHVTDIANKLQNLRSHAELQCYMNNRPAVTLPQTVTVMERHRFSSQVFIPLDVSRYIVAVAPSDDHDRPDTSKLRCFYATETQAINFRAGVWHCPMSVLDRPAQFTVLMWKDFTADDTQFVDIDTPLEFVD